MDGSAEGPGYLRGVADRDDDLDWLYRRGRYSQDGTPEPDRTRAMPPGDRVSSASARPAAPPENVRWGRPEPTPVADYRAQEQPQPRQAPPTGPQGSYPPPPGRAPRRRRRRPIGRLILLALVLFVAYVVAVPLIAWSNLDTVAATPNGARPAQQPGELYVLAGSDSREGLSSAERSELGTGSTVGKRTDTIMMLYVPPSGRPALISVPRDSYVRVPGHGRNKINASYAIGGPTLLVQTIEQNTGLRVDGYIEVGFGGFVQIIDAVGGIDMCLDSAIKDKDSHLDLPAGCQTMNGVTALGYVRMRKADPRGDLGRVERQRAMIAAVAKKAASPWSVIIPTRYWGLNKAAASALTVGEGTGTMDVAKVGLAFMNVSRGDGLTLTVPVQGAAVTTAAGSSLLWDSARSTAMFNEIAQGDTSNLDRFKK